MFRSPRRHYNSAQVDLPLKNADFAQVEVLVWEGGYHRVDALFLQPESPDSVSLGKPELALPLFFILTLAYVSGDFTIGP